MGKALNKQMENDLNWEVKPTICSRCGTELRYRSHGEYICDHCGNVERDDFGKVRHFIELNGPTPAILISEGTGVAIDIINRFLRQGRVEIPEGSDMYIKCENCGTDIRFGRYCPACAAKLTKKLQGAFEAGEVPKSKVKSEDDSKMHFLGKGKRRY